MTDPDITREVYDECSFSVQCEKCLKLKACEDFWRKTSGSLWSKCKECVFDDRQTYYSTLEGFLKNLLHGARNSAKIRLEQGRLSAGQCDIVYDDLHAQWVAQRGLCYYSGLPMVARSFSDWQCSLERIDQNLGYSSENIVFCCAEFNNAYQWSVEKVKRMLVILEQDDNIPAVEFYPARKTHDVRGKPDIVVKDGVEYIECTRCDNLKIRKDFPKVYSPGCKECRKKQSELHRQTPAGHLRQLMVNIRERTKKKQKKSDFEDCDLTYDALTSMYRSQNGLCAYSGLPLTFGHHATADWVCSVERRDEKKGYTLSNTCLICVEFNTSIRTCKNESYYSGNSGWTADKFKTFVACASKKL